MADKRLVETLLDLCEQRIILWKKFIRISRVLFLLFSLKLFGIQPPSVTCHTEDLLCKTLCVDNMFPITPSLFWVYQLIFVYQPSFIYWWYRRSVNLVTQKKKEKDIKQLMGDSDHSQDSPPVLDDKGKVHNAGTWLKPYTISVIFTILVEVGFIAGHSYLYGYTLNKEYSCEHQSCSHSVSCSFVQTLVDISISTLMVCLAFLSVLYNVLHFCILWWMRLLQQDLTVHASPDTSECKVCITNPEAVSLLPSQ